jgi:hypothetical protein
LNACVVHFIIVFYRRIFCGEGVLIESFCPILFLAYFQFLKKYAIVRYVRTSVDVDNTPQGIDRSRSFSAQSIAYDPKACTKEGIFRRTSSAPGGGILVKISLYFHVKIRFPIIIQDLRKGD